MNLYQDVFFRSLDFARGRRTIERLHFLRRSQFWDQETLGRWQITRLNALLAQARTNSPYYQSALANIRLPLASIAELGQLPILSKDLIRRNFEGLQARNIPRHRFVMNRTGGSTGEPTFYFWDRLGMDWNRASVYRSAEWAGVALGERTIQMSGSHFDYSEMQKLTSRIVYFLQRYRDFSVAFLTDDLLEKYFRRLCAWRPTSIWGYASGLTAFAAYIKTHHPDARFDFLRALITSSETLRPDSRTLINEVFGAAKVFDHYGSREMYFGAECGAHDGYHLHAEVLILEVVDSLGQPCPPGQLGRIVVTDLSNHAFPFIRYEIGDVGILADGASACSCGVTLPRLAKVEGRIGDLIVLDDRILTPPNFATLFSDMRGIRGYQIRQDSIDEIRILVVPDADYSADVASYLVRSIGKMAAGHATVRLEEVQEIPVSESGKRRYIISTVGQDRL